MVPAIGALTGSAFAEFGADCTACGAAAGVAVGVI